MTLSVANPGAQTCKFNQSCTIQLTATGGTAPLRLAASGLPFGLSIDATTGRITGKPWQVGTLQVTATATDSAGASASTTVPPHRQLVLTSAGRGDAVYLSASRAADTTAGVRTRPPRGTRVRRAVAGNVIALGAVSLLTDVSAEMVTAVLPLYLVVGLGMSPLAFGALDGLYQGATVLSRLAGGHLADRAQRRKLVAGTGYAISAGCKLALLAVTTPWADRCRPRRGPHRQGAAHRPARRADLPVLPARGTGPSLRGAPGDGHRGRAVGPARRLRGAVGRT